MRIYKPLSAHFLQHRPVPRLLARSRRSSRPPASLPLRARLPRPCQETISEQTSLTSLLALRLFSLRCLRVARRLAPVCSLTLRSRTRNQVSPGCRCLLGLRTAAWMLRRNMTRTYPWTTTRHSFWAFDLGPEVRSTFVMVRPLVPCGSFCFRLADILLVVFFPPADSALHLPCICARPFQLCIELCFSAVYPCLFLEFGHGRTVFFVGPSCGTVVTLCR